MLTTGSHSVGGDRLSHSFLADLGSNSGPGPWSMTLEFNMFLQFYFSPSLCLKSEHKLTDGVLKQ